MTLSLPLISMGDQIPRVVYQTYSDRLFTSRVQENISSILSLNPGWVYRGFNDDEAEAFILREYGRDVFARYSDISPKYGAARADLFRYLLIYRLGGVYLDLKSTVVRPLDQMLRREDQFILAQWDNGPGRPFQGYGVHKELVDLEGGEFQQWFIISVAGHPFLGAVIREVLSRIDAYRPWRQAVGRLGVVRTTGPIPFTQAILPLMPSYPHRRVVNESAVGLQYSFNSKPTAHVDKAHYWVRKTSVIRGRGILRAAFLLYGLYMLIARSYKVNKITRGLLPVNREK